MLSVTTGWSEPRTQPEIAHALEPAGHPLLVAGHAGHVDAVRAADVERPPAVQILQPRAVGGGRHRAQIEALTHERRERGRHPVGVGEAEIGKALANRVAPGPGPRALFTQERGEPLDPLAPTRDPPLGRPVGAEELRVRVGARPHPSREPTRQGGRQRARTEGGERRRHAPREVHEQQDERGSGGQQTRIGEHLSHHRVSFPWATSAAS